MKKIISIMILSTFIISGCNSLEEIQQNAKAGTERDTSINKEEVENKYIAETTKYLNGIPGYIDEMNLIFNDANYVEVKLNSLNSIAMDLLLLSNEGLIDSELALLDTQQHEKYKLTDEKVYEVKKMISAINEDISEATLNYDESLIVKARGNVMKLENLVDEAIKQLQADRLQ